MVPYSQSWTQVQPNKNYPGEVVYSDVGSITESTGLNLQAWIYKLNLQTRIYKLDLQSTNIDFDIHKLLEPYTSQNLLDNTVAHFWTNWKKSTQVIVHLGYCGRCFGHATCSNQLSSGYDITKFSITVEYWRFPLTPMAHAHARTNKCYMCKFVISYPELNWLEQVACPKHLLQYPRCT